MKRGQSSTKRHEARPIAGKSFGEMTYDLDYFVEEGRLPLCVMMLDAVQERMQLIDDGDALTLTMEFHK